MNSLRSNEFLLLKLFNFAGALWFAAGLTFGITGWVNGSSLVAAYGIRFASGFGVLLLLQVALQITLVLLGRFSRPSIARLAVGDFYNLQPSVLAGLARATGVFVGLGTVAFVCWATTGSANALVSGLIASIFTAALMWFAYSLRTFERLLPARP